MIIANVYCPSAERDSDGGRTASSVVTGMHVTSRCHCGNFRNDLPHNRATFVIRGDARVISFRDEPGEADDEANEREAGERGETRMGKGGTTDRIDGPYSRFEIFAGRRRCGAARRRCRERNVGRNGYWRPVYNRAPRKFPRRRSTARIIACRRVRIIVRRNTINSYVSPYRREHRSTSLRKRDPLRAESIVESTVVFLLLLILRSLDNAKETHAPTFSFNICPCIS